jgi:putative phosphoribosyl transferase
MPLTLQVGVVVKFFVDRGDAGRAVARALSGRVPSGAIVLGMPLGGIDVAFSVARGLGLRFEPWLGGGVELAGQVAILVDDGLGSPAVLADAVRRARAEGARKVIVALPVGAVSDVEALEDLAHEVVCPLQPACADDLAGWYEDTVGVARAA